MIQIAAPAANTPHPTGRPAPVAAGAASLAFLLPGAEADVVPQGVAGVDAPAGERQPDAAPGSDLPEGATDDLRFLAALLPGVPLPLAPKETADLPAAGPVATVEPAGPKAARWTLPAISTVKPQPQPQAVADVAPSLPLPDGRPVGEEPLPGVPAPVPFGGSPGTAPLPARTAGRETDASSPAALPNPLSATGPAPVAPQPAAEPSTPPTPVVLAARTMVADAIRAGVRIEPVPLPAAPVSIPAPIALPANWQAQAAPVVAVAAPVSVAAVIPVPATPSPGPVAPLPVAGMPESARPVPSTPIDPRPTPVPPPLQPAAPDPAAAPGFAAAVTVVIQPAGKDRDPADPNDPLAAISPAATTPPVATIAPATGGERSMLDLTQERWPQAMVAHIERLRDAADAADTRIRLVPDALGAIDIGVRQEGETLHVHFTAAEAQTRSLLQEAQPRLAEAAEQRGLKLGQTSVGQNQAEAGAGQRQPHSQPHSQPQHQAAPSPRPASPTRTASTRDADDDARLA